MRAFINQFKTFFMLAALFSFVINMLLLTPSLYMLQVYDRVLASRSQETLWMLTLILGATLLAMGVLELLRSRLLVLANNAMDALLAPELLARMISSTQQPDVNQYAHGLKDLQAIKSFLTGSGILALFDAPWLPVYLLILWFMHPLLFWVAAVGTLLMVSLTIINELTTRQPMEEANTLSRQAAGIVSSGVRNAESLLAMGMQQALISRWRVLNDKALHLQGMASTRAGIVSGCTKFVRQFIQSVMLGVGAWLVITDHGLTPGLMIAGTIMLGKALSPIEHLIASWKALLEARSAYGQLDCFISQFKDEHPQMELPAPLGQLRLEQIRLDIRGRQTPVLHDISFELQMGESLGIIGPSAAGKSSLARIITGVWRPTGGTVRLDGADISSWDQEKLGRYLGYLPQDIELFSGTIAENIARLGHPDTKRVITAASMAGVHEMVLQLSDGYDTLVGDGRTVLSGGQRQRIALARALYERPGLVVLDEPNANLDDAGEAALLRALDQLKQSGSTTVVISHKLSLLAKVDTLLVLQDGAVALHGPREAVLQHLMQAQKQAARQPAAPVAAIMQPVALKRATEGR